VGSGHTYGCAMGLPGKRRGYKTVVQSAAPDRRSTTMLKKPSFVPRAFTTVSPTIVCSTACNTYLVASNPGRSPCSRSPVSGFPAHSARQGRKRRLLVDHGCLGWKLGSETEAVVEAWLIRWRGNVSRHALLSYVSKRTPTYDGW
jgi:hypothetical protein